MLRAAAWPMMPRLRTPTYVAYIVFELGGQVKDLDIFRKTRVRNDIESSVRLQRSFHIDGDLVRSGAVFALWRRGGHQDCDDVLGIRGSRSGNDSHTRVDKLRDDREEDKEIPPEAKQ